MNVLMIAKRDLKSYLHGYTAYAIMAAVLFAQGLFFNAWGLGGGSKYSHEVLESFFTLSFGFTVTAGVLITMRSLAEERQTGTDVLYLGAPIRDGQIILGKYLAAMAFIAMLCGASVYMPALVFVNGKVALGQIAVGYLGVLAAGSAAVGIGIFGSSLFRSQVAAALTSAVITVTFLIAWMLSDLLDQPFTNLVAYAALYDKHFQPFGEGRLLLSGLVYYASITWAFLLMATRVLEGRRWK